MVSLAQEEGDRSTSSRFYIFPCSFNKFEVKNKDKMFPSFELNPLLTKHQWAAFRVPPHCLTWGDLISQGKKVATFPSHSISAYMYYRVQRGM